MADWDFDNWVAVCKDCERYQTEIRELKEKQDKVQELLKEKNQFVEDAKNFRQLIVNTDGVYKNLSKVVTAKQKIKERNALYQERQKLMLSVMSRLTVLIFSSLHYIKLWEDEHKVAQRAIDVTVEQRKQLLEKDVKLLSNEQLLKQYMALVAEQAEKLKLTGDLEKEITILKNVIRKQSRHHQRTLQRAASAFLEILSYFHQKRKLSRKQINWLEICEKSMAGKKIQESVRYNPLFKTDGPTANAAFGDEDGEDTNDDEPCVPSSARKGTFKDVAVGASDYAFSHDVCVDTEDLMPEVCGVAGRTAECAGITITSGADDGCCEKSPDSGIQIPQSPLSQTSDYSNSSVESCHHSIMVPSSPPLEDGYMSDSPTTPYVDWSIMDHDYHIRYDDSHIKPREESSNQNTHSHCIEFTKDVDAARTSTPDAMEVLGSDSIAPDVGMSVEKQLKNLFSEGGEAPPICYLGKKKVFTPVKEKHSRISTEAVTHINKWKVAISVGEDTCIDEQKTHTCEDDRTRSGNQKVSPLTENPSGVEEQKAKSLEAIMFGDSDDVVAEAGFENQPVELDEGKVGEVSRPTGTLTQELAEGTAVKLTVPRNEPATVLEDDKMAPSSRNVKNLMKSIFDEPSEEEEKSFGKEVGRALGDGVCVDKQQVSVEEDLFGDTDEDDGWEATDDQSESLPEGGERTCSGVFELADRDVCVEKEESMLLGDTTGVNLTSAVGQNVCADAKEGEAIRAGKLTAETLKEGKLGSDQVQNLTNCFGDAGKDDKVRSVDNTISSDIKGIGISDQQIRVGERELVKDGGEDRQQHVSEKVPSRIGEVVAEDKGTCITKHQVCNEESARSEDGQKVCENILSCVDNLLHQREDTKSPDINRMIAEFKQFFLLSPLSPDVVDEENGGDKNDCERTQVNDAGASELTTVTSVAVVHVQQLESESCVDNDNRPGSCAIEIRDVDEKHREAKETLEHDRSDLIAGKENEMEEKPSTEVCRVRRTSMRNYNQHKIINLLENSTVSKITNDLKGSLDTYFTKIMEESVRKREFEEFVRKEFTPFKNTIIETLEAIKTELTMYHDTRPKAQGGKSECSTQRVLKRKRNCAGHSRRKRVPSSSLSQKTCETMGTAFFKQSTSGRVVRNTSVDSNFPSGEEKGESGESSECGSEGETRRMKLSRKRIRRRILRSSDSSDDDYKNLKHQCEVVCKVSLENTFKSDTSKIKHTAVPVAVDEEMDETNLEGVERENINVMNNEINKQYSHEELAGTDRNLDIESEGEVERISSETMHVSPKRNTARGRSNKRNTKLANEKQKCKNGSLYNEKDVIGNENQRITLRGQRNNLNLKINNESMKCVVNSPTVDQCPLNTTDRLEQFGFKETGSKIWQVHKEDNLKISENEINKFPGYKMPNAKPSRIAHKGKDDFKQTLLPDDLELNLKREHLSKLLKTNTNSRPVRKVKRPSLLKRIISKCERRSKIRAVEGKETKPTRRSPRNTRACKGSEENESITNDGDKINSNAENCKEMLLSSSLECSALNGNTDRCETPMLAECPKSESTTKINESSFCNGVDECTTPSNVEDSQADLQSVRQESSLCNDTDGCVTPTFTEYYKTKLQLRHEFLACNDNTDGCRTPTFSEYYKMDVTSQKAYFSESNNINKSKTFTKEDCRKLEMQPARDSPEHSKNCGITEPFNSTLQSSGIQPSKYNGDIDGRVTPNLSDYYSEDLLPFPLQKTYGSNSNTSDGSRLDVNVGVVENLLDYVANTPRVGSQQTSSKIKSLAQLNTQVGPNSVGHLVISTNDELVSVEEGITLTNHSDRCGDHALYSNSIKTEPIKVEYDSDNIAESDMSEDDGWHLKVTPFVRSYSKKKCCTSLPIKKEVGLMQSCNRELLETNSNTTDATNIGESASEDMISVDAVANDSDSSVGSSGDGKEVVNNNIIEARVVMADPVDSSVSPVLKSRHCAAMVVSKPLSSSLMVKPSRSLNLTLPKPICSVIAPYNTCFPAAEVPKILQSTSTEKSETVHDAGAEIPKNLQGASVKEPNIVHNGAADLLQRLRSAHRKEPKSLHNAATEIANVVTHPPPKAMCSAVEMPKEIPGPSGKNCRRSHNAAANLHKQAGCGNNEAASTCLCFQDCWKNYVVRFQRRVRNDRNLKNVKLNHMESYADKILCEYLQKEVSQSNVDATIYSLINCTRGMNSSILAICIVRATMEYISTQYEALQSGMPALSGTEHHLLPLVFKLTSVTNFTDVKDCILSYISYGMFRLCRTPQATVLHVLSRFYVLVCLRYGQYNHILMLCCDALYALNYGAFPVIHAALLLYDKTLLKAYIGKEHPLCLVISHVLLSQKNSNSSPLFKVEAVKNLVCRKFGYQRGEFMFRDVLKKLSDWLREGRLNYIERAILILAKKEPWYVVDKEIVQKQLMGMITAWQDKQLSDRVILVVIRLLGYIPRSFPRGSDTFSSISEIVRTLSSLLGRPGNFAQFEETVITAIMALSNHCFRQVFNIVYSWKPLRPVPNTFFDVLFSTRNFKDWPPLLAEAKSNSLFGEVKPVPLVAETKLDPVFCEAKPNSVFVEVKHDSLFTETKHELLSPALKPAN